MNKYIRKILDECLACIALVALILFIQAMKMYEKITKTKLIEVDGSI